MASFSKYTDPGDLVQGYNTHGFAGSFTAGILVSRVVLISHDQLFMELQTTQASNSQADQRRILGNRHRKET